MGNPGGCVPTVKTVWNFPTSKSDGSSPGSGGPPGVGTKVEKIEMRGHFGSKHIDLGGKNGGLHTGNLKFPGQGSGTGRHRIIAAGALKLQPGSGSNVSTGGVKTTGIKTTNIKVTGLGSAGPKTPTITTPAVKTPNVKVNVRVNIPTPRLH
jgi:hypothetical protein